MCPGSATSSDVQASPHLFEGWDDNASLDDVFGRVARLAAGLLDASVAALVLVDEGGAEVMSVHGHVDGAVELVEAWADTVVEREPQLVVEDLSGVNPPSRAKKTTLDHGFLACRRLPIPMTNWGDVADTSKAAAVFAIYCEAPRDELTEVEQGWLADIAGLLGKDFERQRLARRHRLTHAELGALFEHSPISIAFADPERRLMRVNRAFLDLYGYPEHECLGRTTEFLYADPADYGKTGENRFNIDAPVNPDAYIVEYRRQDGTTFLGETTGVHLRDPEGTSLGYIGVTRDLSAQIAFETERRDFVAMVAHELRTPLTSLLGALALLDRKQHSAGVDHLIAMASRNGKRLSRLVDDILDIQKIAGGNVALEPVLIEPSYLIEEVVYANTPYAEKHGVKLRAQPGRDDARICVDPSRFEQVLTNLVSNAIKASPADGIAVN